MWTKWAARFLVCVLAATYSVAAEKSEKTEDSSPPRAEEKADVKAEVKVDRSRRGPDIVLIEQEDQTTIEYRQNDRLQAIKVIPKRGRPYYLVPEDPSLHGGDLERAERLIPSWVIKRF